MEIKTLEDVKGKFPVIDGDTLVYRCGFAGEKTKYLVEAMYDTGDPAEYHKFDSHKEAKAFLESKQYALTNLWSRKEIEPLENVLQILKSSINNILDVFALDVLPANFIYISGKKNFRDEIAVTKPYKGNRELQQKPKYYNELRQYLIDNWGARVTDGIEADDALAIRVGELGLDKSVIVTNDKDLDQVAGWHYDWTCGVVYKNTPKDASFSLYQQILTGDSTDNVPGLPGIGPVKASQILEGSKNTKELFERTWAAYLAHCGTEERTREYFLEQAKLVYILRKPGDSYYQQGLT